jgi:hypothetical protein
MSTTASLLSTHRHTTISHALPKAAGVTHRYGDRSRVFLGVGAGYASSLVGKSKAGSAIALMIGGLTVAMVVGVPLGS